MIDCHKHVVAYHNDEITLPEAERGEMRDRRNANRDRIKARLKVIEKPAPAFFASQGSYGDKTMVRYPDKDYDIDDGVYFRKDDLVGPNGGEMTALQARKMVFDALNDGSFKTPPELHTNCIRVLYTAGYNVDVPVYRIVIETDVFGNETEYVELAGADWIRSDARDVSTWFDDVNQSRSPDTENGRQFRRIVRDIKKLTNSRKSWRKRILSGYGVTILAAECYVPSAERDDYSLHATLRAMHNRLKLSLAIQSPVEPYDHVAEHDDARSNYFKARLDDLEGCLNDITAAETEDEALDAWSYLYSDNYFSDRKAKAQTEALETKSADGSLLGLGLAAAGVAVGVAALSGARAKSSWEPSEAVSKGGGRTNA